MSVDDIESDVIGEGTYGCVHRPPMKCKNKTRKNSISSISKLMTDSNARNELREFKLISSADKKKQLYLGKPSKCKADRILSNIQSISKCSGRFNPKMIDDYSLLLMKYGGQDLEQFGNEVYTWTKTNENVDKIELFWLECVRLFYGLKVFQENGIVHHDLKQQNIVYNQNTTRINFIDFGFMTKKNTILDLAEQSKYWLGDKNHWSFPLENVYWNKRNYLAAITDVNTDTTETYTSFAELVVKYCGYFFTSILPVNADNTKYDILTQRATIASFENVIEFEKDEYGDFIDKSVDTIDSYGVGIALTYVLIRSKHLLSTEFGKRLRDFFIIDMINPKIFIRLTPDQLLAKYEDILTNSGFLEKHKLQIQNHLIENKLSKRSKIVSTLNSRGFLIKPPGFSSTEIEIVRDCPDEKEFNPLTKRCIKVCKPRYVRNPNFKCVLDKLQPKTRKQRNVKAKSQTKAKTRSVSKSKSKNNNS
jgi:serine/threonine protein kinase